MPPTSGSVALGLRVWKHQPPAAVSCKSGTSSTLIEAALTPMSTSAFFGAGGAGTGPNEMVSGTVPTAHHSFTYAAVIVPVGETFAMLLHDRGTV